MTPPGQRLRFLPFQLLAITPSLHAGLVADVTAATAAGAARVAILLRDRTAAPATLAGCAAQLLPICRRHGSLLLILDSLAIARTVGADGVHLPDAEHDVRRLRESLPPGMLIGVSRHSAAAVQAEQAASYVTFSPVFSVPGKAPPAGTDALARACAGAPVPVVALGGITAGNAAGCIAAGASAVAAMRAVWDGDAAGNVLRLLGALA